jgi:hypothetical protein
MSGRLIAETYHHFRCWSKILAAADLNMIAMWIQLWDDGRYQGTYWYQRRKEEVVPLYDKGLDFGMKVYGKIHSLITVQWNVTGPIIALTQNETAWTVNIFSDRLLILALNRECMLRTVWESILFINTRIFCQASVSPLFTENVPICIRAKPMLMNWQNIWVKVSSSQTERSVYSYTMKTDTELWVYVLILKIDKIGYRCINMEQWHLYWCRWREEEGAKHLEETHEI